MPVVAGELRSDLLTHSFGSLHRQSECQLRQPRS